MENLVKGIYKLVFRMVLELVGIVVTVISIIVTVIGIRQTKISSRHQKSNLHR